MVDLEFTPEGASEPVHVLDRVDLGSVSGLTKDATVRVFYSVSDPRVARMAAGTRTYAVNALVYFLVLTYGLAALIVLVVWPAIGLAEKVGPPVSKFGRNCSPWGRPYKCPGCLSTTRAAGPSTNSLRNRASIGSQPIGKNAAVICHNSSTPCTARRENENDIGDNLRTACRLPEGGACPLVLKWRRTGIVATRYTVWEDAINVLFPKLSQGRTFQLASPAPSGCLSMTRAAEASRSGRDRRA